MIENQLKLQKKSVKQNRHKPTINEKEEEEMEEKGSPGWNLREWFHCTKIELFPAVINRVRKALLAYNLRLEKGSRIKKNKAWLELRCGKSIVWAKGSNVILIFWCYFDAFKYYTLSSYLNTKAVIVFLERNAEGEGAKSTSPLVSLSCLCDGPSFCCIGNYW